MPIGTFTARYDLLSGEIEGRGKIVRRLSDLSASFADAEAYRRQLAAGDPVLYHTSQVEDPTGDGDLHYALGVLYPGKVGSEYYMTKGHLHAWRPAAEVYLGLAGRGMMLLEDEATGESLVVALEKDSIVYVPGCTMHRTVNVGDTPLVYWGILSSRAGHDYSAVAERNFRQVIVERDQKPLVLERGEFLAQLRSAEQHD